MWIIFGPSKTLLKSSKSCGCETFRVLKYFLLIFQLYTHPFQMILSRQKCCLLLNGASTESQKLTRVRQIRRDFSPTRNMAVDIDTTDNQNDNHKVTWWYTAVCFSAVVIAGHLHEESLKSTMHSRCFLSIYCCKELPDKSLLSTLLFIWWLVQHCWWL